MPLEGDVLLHTLMKDHDDTTSLLRSIDSEYSEAEDEVEDLTLSFHSPEGLGRHLGLFSTTLLIIGRIVGTGIFSTPSSITASVGSVGAALTLWLVGLVISFCGLYVWLEYGCMFPVSGGEKVYLEAAFPRPRFLATILSSVYFVFLHSCAGGTIIFSENLSLAVTGHSLTSDFRKRIIAVTTIFAVATLHSILPKPAVKIMNTLSMSKVFILGFIILTGVFILTWGVDTVPDPQAGFHDIFAGSSTSIYDYSVALLKVVATYQGWATVGYVMSEVKDPVRNLKLAGPLALTIVGTLYMLTNIAYFASATPKEISGSGTIVAAFFLGKVFGESAKRIAAAFVALSALGNVMVVSFSLSRVYQEIAKEGILPFSRFWASNSAFGTPAATLFLVVVTTSTIILSLPFGDAYNFVMDAMTYPQAIIAFFVTIGLFYLRHRSPEITRPFRIWPSIAVAFLISQGLLIITPFFPPLGGKGDTSLPFWLAPTLGTGFLFCGFMYWFLRFVALPRVGGYTWETKEGKRSDGPVLKVWYALKYKKVSKIVVD